MTALPAVRGGDDASGFAPGFKDTLDRRGREVGAVCEDDDRDLDFVSERSEPAPKGRSRSASQNAGEEQTLLGSTEPRSLAGREDDRGDMPH